MKHPRHGGRDARGGTYGRFALMIALSFVTMYAFMYAMVNTFENVVPNNNQLYMAGLMAAPMAIFELVLMGGMYPNKKLNLMIIGIAALGLIGFWVAIRGQAAISDRQFLKSMIPHHAGAILMCNEASIHDAQIQDLCRGIISSQQSEIELMRALLGELDRH